MDRRRSINWLFGFFFVLLMVAVGFAAEASRDALLRSGKLRQIFTEITAASPFYLAEEYHQDY